MEWKFCPSEKNIRHKLGSINRIDYLCLAGVLVTSLSLKQYVAGSNFVSILNMFSLNLVHSVKILCTMIYTVHLSIGIV